MDDDITPVPGTAADQADIESIVRTFFAAFTSGSDSVGRLAALRSLFLPEAVIVRTCGTEPTVYGVEGFIAPREALLTSGALTDFSEWAVLGRLDLFGDIAHWYGSYAKTGVLDGAPLTGRGMKSLQFVRSSQGWRISAAAWDDERDGVAVSPAWLG